MTALPGADRRLRASSPGPHRAALCGGLWALFHGTLPVPKPPAPGAISVAADGAVPEGFWRASGFLVFGDRAVRADMVERLAVMLHQASGTVTATPAMMAL